MGNLIALRCWEEKNRERDKVFSTFFPQVFTYVINFICGHTFVSFLFLLFPRSHNYTKKKCEKRKIEKLWGKKRLLQNIA